MDRYDYYVEEMRFHLKEPNTLVIRGWFREDNPQNRKLEVRLDGTSLPFRLETRNGVRIRQKYMMYHAAISEEVTCMMELPQDWKNHKKLQVITTYGNRSYPVAKASVAALIKQQKNLNYNIENETLAEGKLQLTGWVVGVEPVKISFFDGDEKIEMVKIQTICRRDVMEVFEEGEKDTKAGFTIEAPIPRNSKIKVVLQADGKTTVYKTTVSSIRRGKKKGLNAFQKFISYWQKEGLASTINRVKVKLFKHKNEIPYEEWRKKHLISEEELERQRQQEQEFSYRPKFSIVVPLYKTKEAFLRELIDSVVCQTYTNWELCFADGSGQPTEPMQPNTLQKLVADYQNRYPNIRYTLLTQNGGISENTNAAIEMASGDFIVLSDHDDTLSPDALFECAKAINEQEETDVLYSDEDKVDMNGKKYFEPHFKSDYNIDLLCSVNYICHLFVVKRSLVEKIGMLRKEFDGAQDYDFILRCCEEARRIVHIPKVLYHWRSHMDSTAANPESKLYAFEAGRRAVEAHYQRLGIPASVERSQFHGIYNTKYHWKEQPLVSIVIPNKDHIEDLKKCMDSIDKKSGYRNYEYVIVENNSTEEGTFAFYQELEKRENVTILYYEGGFNYSKINNFGVKYTKGDYVLLLNNDTAIINEECIWEMLSVCMREDVGVVGARLYYGDNTIQHAGVVVGFGGMAGHAFIGESRYDLGYMGRIICTQDYSAVTAACLMTKKSVYEAVGGLTAEFVVAFNDIDYCLKVRETGKLVVYNPMAELYHYESKSRGLEDTPEKIERFNGEVARLTERWAGLLKQGDPYYNPNLTLDKADFSLKY